MCYFIFLVFLTGGVYKKVNVFESFIEGAKGGFEIAIKIIPYLVAMLVAISVLRTSGAFEFITDGMKTLFSYMGMDTQFVSALRHDPSQSAFCPNFRQLLHLAFKIAAEMREPFFQALDQARELVEKNVTTNLWERHLRPLGVT